MINGTVMLEDYVLTFQVDHTTNKVIHTVYDTVSNTLETFSDTDASKFFKALAIAVHYEGMPNYEVDYPDAESIMGKLRWIP